MYECQMLHSTQCWIKLCAEALAVTSNQRSVVKELFTGNRNCHLPIHLINTYHLYVQGMYEKQSSQGWRNTLLNVH